MSGGRRTEDTLKPSQAYYSPAQRCAERHCNARDVQDILPASASAGQEATLRSVRRRRRPGPKRKDWMPNPFGKYVAASSVKKYIEATNHYYAPSTQKERRRKITHIARVLRTLGVPSDPRKVRQENVFAFVDWMEKKNLEGSTKRKLLRFLNDYLIYYANDVVSLMRARKILKLPTDPQKAVRHLPEDVVERIHNITKTMDGWNGSIARFITVVYPYTGLRPSELRRMELRDVDLANWTMLVRHPKGEASYGRQRPVLIPSCIREVFSDYMEERRRCLEENGLSESAPQLIPKVVRRKARYWCDSEFIRLKMKIERTVGLKFKLKDYRATFCQMTIDRGAELQAVSRVMGHKTTMTTELYYGRMRDEPAMAEIERVLSKPSILSSENDPERKGAKTQYPPV